MKISTVRAVQAFGFAFLTTVAITALPRGERILANQGKDKDTEGWTTEFGEDKKDLTHTGRNPFFILEPGHYIIMESGDERMVHTVLDETKVIDGVETRVVEEKETKGGKPNGRRTPGLGRITNGGCLDGGREARMRIGMNLLLYNTQPDDSIFPIVEKLRGMGFDSFEWPIFGPDPAMQKKIGAFNRQHGLDATAVTVFPPGASPVSAEAAERKLAWATIAERIDICETMGVGLLVGPIVQTLGQFTGARPTAEERKRCVEMLRHAGDHAARRGVTLAVEYLNRFEIYMVNTAADAAKLCDEVDHPRVKMMYDSFHAHIEEKCQREAIKSCARHLIHVHVSENDRGVPGSGQVRWDDYFGGLKDIGFDGRYTIESFADALPDLAAAAKIWRPLFKHVDDVPRDGIAFIKKNLGK